MKEKWIRLLVVVMLTLSVTSCAGLRKTETREEILPRIITVEDKKFFCIEKEDFKILLKEAYR